MSRKSFGKSSSRVGLARRQQIRSAAEVLAQSTHFNTDECRSLINIHERIDSMGKVDRLRFREILHTTLGITDDIMLDSTFHAFDRNNDGIVDQVEWVQGMSVMIRGDPNEMIEFCYFVYDMNGDKSLAREELYQCLKGCILPGYAVDADEIDECEKDIVEIAMRKLDKDRDGQITFQDFRNAVREDPLLLQACGPCIPTQNALAAFLACVTENYRDYTSIWGHVWEETRHRLSLSKAPSKFRTTFLT